METSTILHHPCSPIFKPPRIHLPHSPQNPNLPISSLKLHNTPKPLFSSNLHSPLFSIIPIIQNPRRPFSPVLNSLNPKITHVHTYPQIKTLSDLKNKLLSQISKATPYVICKWVFIISLLIAVTTNTTKVLLNPFFWMYFSWTWLFWPWFLAIFLGIYGVFSAIKHMKGEASVFEQMVVITSCFTWLTLVPPAHFNGFLEGWPVVFFFVYHYFFFFNVTVRNRLYGDLYPRPHDEKWDIDVPAGFRVLFFTAVMVGHWLAAFEAPPLHQIPGGWINLVIWVGIMLVLFMQYHSVLYLSKYSEKIKVPMSVVQFGPYRWVRHPIYASTMFLFGVYFAALRAPLSLLFILAVCVLYYEQKTRLEEDLMVETFGEEYTTYCDKVRYKFIPLVC